MTEKMFKVDLRHQYLSTRKLLVFFGWVAFMILFVGWFKIETDLPTTKNSILLTMFSLFVLSFASPALYLHLTYYFRNKGWVLSVDQSRNKIRIQSHDLMAEYRFEQVVMCELNLGTHHRHKKKYDVTEWSIPSKSYWPAPWMDYGYLRVSLTDGNDFIFTSLMLNLKALPFPVKTTRFRFVPYIERNRQEYGDFKKNLEEIKRAKILEYQERFQNLPDDKLLEKINNPQLFEYEARVAANSIISERRNISL